MKLLLSIIMLLTITVLTAQTKHNEKDVAHYFYGSLSFDANKALGLKDNPRTINDNRGFDWDLELGVRYEHVGVYMFYGRFDPINYQSFGAGVDWYFQWLRNYNPKLYNPFNKKYFNTFDGIEFSLGIYYSQVIRRDIDGNYGSFTAWASPKIKTIFWFNDFGLGLNAKYQGRADINKYVFEGSIELIYKFDRN